MSGGDGMDSTLNYILSDMRVFILLGPFVPRAKVHRFLRPEVGDANPLWGAPGHI
jgi:hypothetical protein